ncbi:MAG: ABC transporter permease [Anaerolineae bacterium]
MLAGKYSEIVTLGLVMVLVAFILTLFIGPRFLGMGNLQSMAFQLPELGILSLAMMITMLTGGINLSIIASANLTGIVTAMILIRYVDPEAMGPGSWVIILLAVLVGLAISAAIGLLNGGLIAWAGVSPILATLGTMILLKGLAIVLTKGYVLSGLPSPILFIGNGTIAGIPVPMILFALCALAMGVILNRTPLGIRVYMIGSNATACFFSGVNNANVLLKTYLISGIYSGLAALVMIARFNSAKADYGESYLLLTVLASVLGGTSAAGGFGRVSGLVLALIILQMVASGLNLLRVSAFLTIAMWGAILILVMVANDLVARYRQRRLLAR